MGRKGSLYRCVKKKRYASTLKNANEARKNNYSAKKSFSSLADIENFDIEDATPVEAITLTDAQRDKLIELYRNEEVLWNWNHPSYNDRSMKCEAMRFEGLIRIATAMDIPGLDSDQVKYLLRKYTEIFRQSLKMPQDIRAHSFWYQNMQFLLNEGDNEELEEEYSNVENDDDAQSDSSNDFIVEIKEEMHSDDETQVGRLGDSKEVDALEVNEERDALAIDNTTVFDQSNVNMAIDHLEDNEPTYDINVVPSSSSPSISSKPTVEPTFTKVFVNTTRHKAVQTKFEELETDRQVRNRKRPSYYGAAQEESKIEKSLLAIAKSQTKIESLLKSQSEVSKKDMFDDFATYVASSLRDMGTYEALALQPKIIELITTQQAKKKAIAVAVKKTSAPLSHP